MTVLFNTASENEDGRLFDGGVILEELGDYEVDPEDLDEDDEPVPYYRLSIVQDLKKEIGEYEKALKNFLREA